MKVMGWSRRRERGRSEADEGTQSFGSWLVIGWRHLLIVPNAIFGSPSLSLYIHPLLAFFTSLWDRIDIQSLVFNYNITSSQHTTAPSHLKSTSSSSLLSSLSTWAGMYKPPFSINTLSLKPYDSKCWWLWWCDGGVICICQYHYSLWSSYWLPWTEKEKWSKHMAIVVV